MLLCYLQCQRVVILIGKKLRQPVDIAAANESLRGGETPPELLPVAGQILAQRIVHYLRSALPR